MVLAFRMGVPGSNPTRALYFCHAFIHLLICHRLCPEDCRLMTKPHGLSWIEFDISFSECYTYTIPSAYPITRRQILDSSKLKEFADDNFKFDENGRKLSKPVEKRKFADENFKFGENGRKFSKKVENTVLRAISPFPTVFTKGLFPSGIKRCHCVGTGYTI